MSISACDAGSAPASEEKLVRDLSYATATVEAITQAIGPALPWRGDGDHGHPCVDADGNAVAYQATYSLWVRAKAVGHDLDDEEASGAARAWLSEEGFEFRRDTRHEGGLREIWAVKEDEAVGIGVVVDAHPGGFRVKATTKCRP